MFWWTRVSKVIQWVSCDSTSWPTVTIPAITSSDNSLGTGTFGSLDFLLTLRISRLYSKLSKLMVSDTNYHFAVQQWTDSLNDGFKPLVCYCFDCCWHAADGSGIGRVPVVTQLALNWSTAKLDINYIWNWTVRSISHRPTECCYCTWMRSFQGYTFHSISATKE